MKSRIQPDRRRVLLSRVIGKVQAITIANFGETGLDRPQYWPSLSESYARKWHDGDRTPTLVLSDERHALRNPGLPHLIDSFQVMLTPNQASLTNLSPYADVHQKGLGWIPARSYYPADEAGLLNYTESEVLKVVEDWFE